MKRIQYACLDQTLHFTLKDGVPKDWALRLVQDEYAAYLRQLEDRRVPHKILSEQTQPDGSIIDRMCTYDEYLDWKLNRN